jgi:hypothetical protein
MMRSHKLDLIQKDVDGLLSRKEQEKLDRLLAVNPKARRLHKDLVRLSTRLNTVPSHEPPEHLSEKIMNQLPQGLYHVGHQRHPLAAFCNRLKHINTQLVYAFSAGLSVASLLFIIYMGTSGQDSPVDEQMVSGALLLERGGADAMETFMVELQGVRGSVTCVATADGIVAEIAVTAERGFEFRVSFDQSAFSIQNIRAPRDGDVGALSVDAVGVTLTGSRTQNWEVILQPRHASVAVLTFRLTSGQQHVEKAVTLTPDHR